MKNWKTAILFWGGLQPTKTFSIVVQQLEVRLEYDNLLQDLPHHAGGVPGAGDEVDATVVHRQAGHDVWNQSSKEWLSAPEATVYWKQYAASMDDKKAPEPFLHSSLF